MVTIIRRLYLYLVAFISLNLAVNSFLKWAFFALAWLSPAIVFLFFSEVLPGLHYRFPHLAESPLYTLGIWSWPVATLILAGILGIIVAPIWARSHITKEGLTGHRRFWRLAGAVGVFSFSILSGIGFLLVFVLLIVVQSDWSTPGFRLLDPVVSFGTLGIVLAIITNLLLLTRVLEIGERSTKT